MLLKPDVATVAIEAPGQSTPNTFPHKGDRFKLRLKLFGHYDIQTINKISSAIRQSSKVLSFFTIDDIEAVSDDNTTNVVPNVSGELEDFSMYISVTYVGPNPPNFSAAQGSASVFDPITLTVCVGAILLLLIGLVVVTGWTAEKLGDRAKELSPFFLGIVVVALLYLVKK